MFERVWIYNTWYTHEALMADDAAWSAAELAHGVCDKRRKRTLAPTREEEEERRRKCARKCARRMAEALFVAGMRSASPQGAAAGAVAGQPDDYNRQSLTGW